jgi:hypothetical protein
LSVKVTVCAPETDAGTVNVAVKPPVEVVVEVLNVTAVPAKVAVTECEPSMPVAVIVTVEPTAPELGLKLIDDVTVNEAVGELVPSVASTVLLPETEAGTLKLTPEGIVPELVEVVVATVDPS